MATTKVLKTIVRGIQTKQFEQVTITVSREEELEWSNDQEKNKKVSKFTEELLEDFTITYDAVCNKLGVNRCIGTVQTSKPVAQEQPSSKTKDSNKEEKKADSQYDF